MKLSPISYFRIVNVFLTAINTGIGTAELGAPWSWIAPLLLGAAIQTVAELIAELTPSGEKGVPNPLKNPLDETAAAIVHSVRETQRVIDGKETP